MPSTTSDSTWMIETHQYVSSSYSYAGYGTGPPCSGKKYKSSKELKEIMPPECEFLGGGKWHSKLYMFTRFLRTIAVAGLFMSGMTYSYAFAFRLVNDSDNRFAIGIYGVFLFAFLILQTVFAALETSKFESARPMPKYKENAPSSIAIQISAHQEDPHYFRECLKGILRLHYPRDKIKIMCCIDGNQDDSVYMAEIFYEVMVEHGVEPTIFRWDYNFHELPDGVSSSDNGVDTLNEIVDTKQFICVLQKWGGKREVMYTAFNSLKGKVDYVQVCDSDTKYDEDAILELAWILDTQPYTGAVGGDVRIWNSGDSFISFLSSLRYWMAFNVERACQSYFGCVSCISGPIGLYRMSLVSQFLDLWSDQKFLGDVCTFGDDRHLTNRILQMGYATKYTSRSFCVTETPAQYTRWLSQQIRWTKSYYREWLFNSMWWHKHSIWMTAEAVFSGAFPFFIMFTIISIVFSGNLWDVINLLLTIQIIGVLRGAFAVVVHRNPVMIFMSLYSCLYITSLLPAKIYAICTMKVRSWGTSGRKNLLKNNNALIPPVGWMVILTVGVVYSISVNDYMREGESLYLGAGVAAYAIYWVVMLGLWNMLVRRDLMTKQQIELDAMNSGASKKTSLSGKLSCEGEGWSCENSESSSKDGEVFDCEKV